MGVDLPKLTAMGMRNIREVEIISSGYMKLLSSIDLTDDTKRNPAVG